MKPGSQLWGPMLVAFATTASAYDYYDYTFHVGEGDVYKSIHPCFHNGRYDQCNLDVLPSGDLKSYLVECDEYGEVWYECLDQPDGCLTYCLEGSFEDGCHLIESRCQNKVPSVGPPNGM